MKILFVDDCNRNEVKNPFVSLVEIVFDLPNEFLIHLMTIAENKQLGVERSGGSWIKIMQNLNFEYTVISKGRLNDYIESDYDIKYKLISGNY